MFTIFKLFFHKPPDDLDQVVDLLSSMKRDLAQLAVALEKAQRPVLTTATIAAGAGALYVAYLLNGGAL